MKVGRKPGIVRRPIEYALWLLIGLLIAILLYSVSVIKKDNRQPYGKTGSPDVPPGTMQEVDAITQAEYEAEQRLDDAYDSSYSDTTQTDSAADNIGGVYDETSY